MSEIEAYNIAKICHQTEDHMCTISYFKKNTDFKITAYESPF